MASETPDLYKVAQALKQVAEDGERLMGNDSAARERLVASARALVQAAETPMESLLWHVWALVRGFYHWLYPNTVMGDACIDAAPPYGLANANGSCPYCR